MKKHATPMAARSAVNAAIICIGLLPSLIVAAPPSPEEIRQGQEIGKRVQEASQFIAIADAPALKKRLAELIAALPKTKWESIYGAEPNEPNALRASWFASALMYPVDSGLAATNADAYVGYMFAKETFAALLDKAPATALAVLESFSDEPPTLLHAMLCGVVVQSGRTPSKATVLSQQLHDASALDAWKNFLRSGNPIIRSLALEMVPADLASSPILTEAIRTTLTNKWVSLQMIAIETAGKHRPPNVEIVLDDYLPRLQSSTVSSAVKEALRAKALESKAALTKPHSGGR